MDPFIHLYIDPFIHLSMNLSIYQSIISSIQLKFLSTYISYPPILNKKGGNLVSCIQMFMYVIFCTVKTFRLPCISLPRFVHNLRYQLSGTQWFRGTTPGFFKKKRRTTKQWEDTVLGDKLSNKTTLLGTNISPFLRPPLSRCCSFSQGWGYGLVPWRVHPNTIHMDFGNRPARRSKCPRSPSMCWDTSGGHLVSAVMTGQPTPVPRHVP